MEEFPGTVSLLFRCSLAKIEVSEEFGILLVVGVVGFLY